MTSTYPGALSFHWKHGTTSWDGKKNQRGCWLPGTRPEVTASWSAGWHPKGQSVLSLHGILRWNLWGDGVDSWHGIILGRRALPVMSAGHPCCGKAGTQLSLAAGTVHVLRTRSSCSSPRIAADPLWRPKHKGSTNWHTPPSLLMKCPFLPWAP